MSRTLTIVNHDNCTLHVEGLFLLRGENAGVDPDLWKQVEDTTLVQEWIREGKIEVLKTQVSMKSGGKRGNGSDHDPAAVGDQRNFAMEEATEEILARRRELLESNASQLQEHFQGLRATGMDRAEAITYLAGHYGLEPETVAGRIGDG